MCHSHCTQVGGVAQMPWKDNQTLSNPIRRPNTKTEATQSSTPNKCEGTPPNKDTSLLRASPA